MSAGFEVVNPSGVVLVDENYVNPVLRTWGNGWAGGSPSFDYPPGGVLFTDITYSGGSAPIFVVYKAGIAGRGDFGAGVFGRSYNAATNTWTFRVLVTDKNGADYSFQYYIFDRPVPVPSGGGVEVYNGAGQMVFSSLFQPLSTKKYSTALPSGKWGHVFAAGVGVQNDTYDISGPNGPVWIDRYRIDVATWACFPTSVVQSTRSYSQDNSRQTWTPSGLENNATEGTFLVDLSRLPG